LRLGYCARQGCESYDYSIHFEDYPGVDWAAVAEEATNHVASLKIAAKEEAGRKLREKRQRRMKRAALALCAILVLLVLRIVVQQGRLAFGQKPHKYEIDPASTPAHPRR
jgi:hypothetical protein